MDTCCINKAENKNITQQFAKHYDQPCNPHLYCKRISAAMYQRCEILFSRERNNITKKKTIVS